MNEVHLFIKHFEVIKMFRHFPIIQESIEIIQRVDDEYKKITLLQEKRHFFPIH